MKNAKTTKEVEMNATTILNRRAFQRDLYKAEIAGRKVACTVPASPENVLEGTDEEVLAEALRLNFSPAAVFAFASYLRPSIGQTKVASVNKEIATFVVLLVGMAGDEGDAKGYADELGI